jgi:hypothetical protein
MYFFDPAKFFRKYFETIFFRTYQELYLHIKTIPPGYRFFTITKIFSTEKLSPFEVVVKFEKYFTTKGTKFLHKAHQKSLCELCGVFSFVAFVVKLTTTPFDKALTIKITNQYHTRH